MFALSTFCSYWVCFEFSELNCFDWNALRDLICFIPFVPKALFPCHLKTSENLTVFWCFQGIENGCIGNKWVKVLKTSAPIKKKVVKYALLLELQSKVVTRRCSGKNVLLKIVHNSQEKAFTLVSFLIRLQAYAKLCIKPMNGCFCTVSFCQTTFPN